MQNFIGNGPPTHLNFILVFCCNWISDLLSICGSYAPPQYDHHFIRKHLFSGMTYSLFLLFLRRRNITKLGLF